MLGADHHELAPFGRHLAPRRLHGVRLYLTARASQVSALRSDWQAKVLLDDNLTRKHSSQEHACFSDRSSQQQACRDGLLDVLGDRCCRVAGTAGGQIAKDAAGNDVKSSKWLASHKTGGWNRKHLQKSHWHFFYPQFTCTVMAS